MWYSVKKPARREGAIGILSYYTANIILCWLALGVLCILAWENDRLRRKQKHLLYLTYALTALAALAEWLGVQLDGVASLPAWPLAAVKCADYILTPLAAGFIVFQLDRRSLWLKVLMLILGANIVLQLVSVLPGWMVEIDASNHYSHGPLFGLYLSIYGAATTMIILEFSRYGRSFRRHNAISLHAILILVLVGAFFQEVLSSEYRTVYLSLTFCMAMMFIHTTEFSQLRMDDYIQAQKIQITTDALTGVKSRYAYSKALQNLDTGGPLPEDLAAFSIDINGLKTVNDTLGHEAGDELICGAANCILFALGLWGECYRTGGDEFVVLARIEPGQVQEAMTRLRREEAAWGGEKVERLRLSAGFALAAEHPGLSAEKLVAAADMKMYEDKRAYYQSTGRDRRRR